MKQIKNAQAEEIVEDPNVLTNEQEKEAFENININQVYENALNTLNANLSLDKNQVSKAIKCIKDLVAKRHKDSLNILSNEDEELIYLNFVLGKLPLKYSLRPVSVPLIKSINGESFNTRVCLFVKDPKADFKQLEIDFPFKVKVIDVQTLKMKYSRFQDRRNLLKQFDLFLCDYKIYFLLKKLLGKPFYVSRKYPLPIKLNYENKDEIRAEVVNHVDNSGVFYMTNGPNYAFKVARYSMDNSEILENIFGAVKYVIAHIMKWGVDFQEYFSFIYYLTFYLMTVILLI